MGLQERGEGLRTKKERGREKGGKRQGRKDTAWNPKRFVCHPTLLPFFFFVCSRIHAKRRVPSCNLVLRLLTLPWNPFPSDILESSKKHDDSVRLETVFLIFSGISFRNRTPPSLCTSVEWRVLKGRHDSKTSNPHTLLESSFARSFPTNIIGFWGALITWSVWKVLRKVVR